jgi:hypothetical protein
MVSFCLLDILPVELFHSIFVYLSPQDVVKAFSDVSNYVNDVLSGYSFYSLELRSISGAEFDLICRWIRPDQVVSLKLCDGSETFGLSKLFFSRFKIEKLVHLRLLSLELIDEDIIDQLIKLPVLKQLSSLIIPIPIIHIRFQSVIHLLLPQLSHLVTCHAQFSHPLPNLKYLSLNHCNKFELSRVFDRVVNLHSLKIHELQFDENPMWANSMCQLIHLRRLVIKADGEYTR